MRRALHTTLMVAVFAACSNSGGDQTKGSGGTSISSGSGSGAGASGSGGASAVGGSSGSNPGSGGGSSTTSSRETGGSLATGGTSAKTGGTTASGGSGTGTKASGGATASQSGGGTSPGSGGTTGASGGTTSAGTGGTSTDQQDAGAGGASGERKDGGSLGGTGGSTASGGTSGADAGTGSAGLSAGCGKTITRPSASAQQNITVGGRTRTYLIDVPASATNEAPLMLIFALHGYNMTNSSVTGGFNFTSRSNGQAITVYPQGLNNAWTSDDTDYEFMKALIADLEGRYCIDPNRVFLTGFSQGGVFANDVACQKNALFRAYAPVEGCGPGGLNAKLNPVCAVADAKPIVMVVVGDSDGTATPEQAKATRDFWVKRNGCSQTTTTSYTGCVTYGGCPDGKTVVYCHGAWGHEIAATATANVWSFFSELK